MLQPGLYEQVINNALNSELAEIPEVRKSTAPIDTAEASKVLTQYLTDVVQKGLENVQDNGGGIEAQIQLANQIVNTIQSTTQEADFASLGVDRRHSFSGKGRTRRDCYCHDRLRPGRESFLRLDGHFRRRDPCRPFCFHDHLRDGFGRCRSDGQFQGIRQQD